MYNDLSRRNCDLLKIGSLEFFSIIIGFSNKVYYISIVMYFEQILPNPSNYTLIHDEINKRKFYFE